MFGVKRTANKNVLMFAYPVARHVANTQAHDLAAHLVTLTGDWDSFAKLARKVWIETHGIDSLPPALASLRKTVKKTITVEVDAEEKAPAAPPALAAPVDEARARAQAAHRDPNVEPQALVVGTDGATLEKSEAAGNADEPESGVQPGACKLCGRIAAPPSIDLCIDALRGNECGTSDPEEEGDEAASE
jgi:hypothetical protein